MANQTKMALIDVAFDIMKNGSSRELLDFRAIFTQVADDLGLSEAEKTEKITQFYTDLNIDGRFMCTPEKLWGLKSWFLVDQIDEEIVSTPKTKKKKAKAVEEDFDSIEEIEREEYSFEEDIEDVEDIDDDADEDADEDIIISPKDTSELDILDVVDSFDDDDDDEDEEVAESLEELASEELDDEEEIEEEFE